MIKCPGHPLTILLAAALLFPLLTACTSPPPTVRATPHSNLRPDVTELADDDLRDCALYHGVPGVRSEAEREYRRRHGKDSPDHLLRAARQKPPVGWEFALGYRRLTPYPYADWYLALFELPNCPADRVFESLCIVDPPFADSLLNQVSVERKQAFEAVRRQVELQQKVVPPPADGS